MSTNEEIFFSFSPSGQWTSLLLSINIYYKIKQLQTVDKALLLQGFAIVGTAFLI